MSRSALAAFVGFALALAGRDLCFKALFAQQVGLPSVLLGTGAGALALLIALASWNAWPLRLARPGLQVLRLAANCLAWILILYTFEHLSATSVSILTKLGLPVTILVAPWFGHRYPAAQLRVASLAALAVLSFGWLTLKDGVAPLAIAALGASLTLTVLELLFLADAVKRESPFYLGAVPALGCLLAGIALGGFHSPAALSLGSVTLMVGAGLLFAVAYLTSLYRYRLLPPGLAEFPSLFSFFILLPIERLWLGRTPSGAALLNALIVLALMSLLILMRQPGALTSLASRVRPLRKSLMGKGPREPLNQLTS